MQFVRKNIIFFILVVISFSTINVNAKDIDTNSNAQALTLPFIEKIFLLNDKDINLNKTLLNISKKAQLELLGEDFNATEYQRQIAKMSKDLSRLIKRQSDKKIIIEKINKYIFDDQNFQVDRSKLFESTLESLLLNQVLVNRKGQCLSLSLVLLCIAERLNLPLYGVLVPGHFFVRYDKDGSSLNIETTDKGQAYPDEYYKKIYLRGFNDKSSLRNLSKKEVIAIYLSNLANHYKLHGDHKKAMDIFQFVITVMPNDASLYTNLGNTYERDKQILKAILSYQKALSLNPYLCEAHYNLGLIHFLYTRRFDDARRHGEVAKSLGCRMHPEFKDFLIRGLK